MDPLTSLVTALAAGAAAALQSIVGVFAYPLEKVYSHGPEWICLWAEWSYYR